MADIVLIVVVIGFVAGALAGAMLLVCMASLREDKMRLGTRPPDRISRAGRLITGLKISEHAPWDGHIDRIGEPVPARTRRYRYVPPAEDDPGF